VNYLVDVNVLSEPTKPNPSADVVEWLRDHESELALDAIVLGEILLGILVLPAGKRRRRLETWFENRVSTMVCLPWDAATGLRWAKLLADLKHAGVAMPIKDSMIAATALVHGLTLATRNQYDFRKAGVRVINPFQ
jgi:hypothetical protein